MKNTYVVVFGERYNLQMRIKEHKNQPGLSLVKSQYMYITWLYLYKFRHIRS
jgi:hypothetical protein